MRHPVIAATVGAAATALLLAGCVPNATADGASTTVVAVESTETACTVTPASVPSGPVTFRVTNAGERVTEFYVLKDDGLSIVAEVENVAPGAERDLTVVGQPGDYFTVCKPGMIGDGIGTTPFTITGEAVSVGADEEAAAAEAVAAYTAYVKSQAAELVPRVQAFVDAYVAGDDDTARGLFASARVPYERIEPTADAFGELDPAIDYRKPGAEAEGIEFTGFHRIEMDLWLDAARANYPDEDLQPLDQAGREAVGNRLVDDVQALYDAVHAADFSLTLSNITNGAIGLLDEISAPDGKLPGEENEFAHTDLSDFLANIEGAQVAFESVRAIAASRSAEGEALVAELDERFADMVALLHTYGSFESGFVAYDTVTQAERNVLGAQLNALSEPLSTLTHAVLGVEPAA